MVVNKRILLLIVLCLSFLSTFYPLMNAVADGDIPNRPWVKSNIDFDYRLYDVDASSVVDSSGVREKDGAIIMGDLLSEESSWVNFNEFSLIMFFMGDNLKEGLHATLHINRVGAEFPVSSVKGAHMTVKLNGIVVLDREMSVRKGPVYTLEPDEQMIFGDGRIVIPLDPYLLKPDISVEIILTGYSSWRISYLSNVNHVDLNEVKPVVYLISLGSFVLYGVFIAEIVVVISILDRLRRWLRHPS